MRQFPVSRIGHTDSLPINVPTMTDVQHRHRACCIVDLVDDSVICDAYAPTFPARKFPATGRAWFPSEIPNGISNSFEEWSRNSGKLFLSSP